ncbi:MAG TPA: hypothetical protein VJO32_01750 [Ktedonobacteraceae bacterium]|nr:hypothetical protein [Ktedonobacteraceae bacterium]
MRSVQSVQRRTWFALGASLALIVFVLAACGSNTSTGSTNAGSGSTPTGVTPTTTASAYGCPGTVMTVSPSPAKIVLKQSDSNATITAHVGDIVEVDLPFGQTWTGPTTSQGQLQLQGPAGYALPTSKVCVWRFTAQSAGTTQVNFYGKAMCQKGQMCPQYIMRIPYTIVIK